MSLKKESLDVKPFQIVYGRLSALNFGRYAIPDFAELQILFFTGRLLYLRQTLVFEFQDWPWSRRWAEWIKTRDSLVCWWGELQKKFSISTSFNVIDCLAQLEMAQLESQIAESSKSVGVSVGPLERRPRRTRKHREPRRAGSPDTSSPETSAPAAPSAAPAAPSAPAPAIRGALHPGRYTVDKHLAWLSAGFERRFPAWRPAVQKAFESPPWEVALRSFTARLDRYLTAGAGPYAEDLRVYGESAARRVPDDIIAERAADKGSFTELLESAGVQMKGIAATTYELFDGLSTADIKNYTTFGSEYAKARVCIDALADACVLLSENLRKHVAGGRGSERPWKVGRTYVRLHATVPQNANASDIVDQTTSIFAAFPVPLLADHPGPKAAAQANLLAADSAAEAARALSTAVEARMGYWEMGYGPSRLEQYVGNEMIAEVILRASKLPAWEAQRRSDATNLEKQCEEFMKNQLNSSWASKPRRSPRAGKGPVTQTIAGKEVNVVGPYSVKADKPSTDPAARTSNPGGEQLPPLGVSRSAPSFSKREEIEALYRKYNPDKLPEVDSMIDYYGEDFLLKRVKEKYVDGIDTYDFWTVSGAPSDAPSRAPPVPPVSGSAGGAAKSGSSKYPASKFFVPRGADGKFTPRPPPYPKPKPDQLKVSPEELGIEMQPKLPSPDPAAVEGAVLRAHLIAACDEVQEVARTKQRMYAKCQLFMAEVERLHQRAKAILGVEFPGLEHASVTGSGVGEQGIAAFQEKRASILEKVAREAERAATICPEQ